MTKELHMNQGNFLGLDIGSRQKLYLDRQRLGAVVIDKRLEDGGRQMNQMPSIELVVVEGFAFAGKRTQLLAPKKGELELWELIVVTPERGVYHWRLDTILGAQRLPDEVPPPASQAPEQNQGLEGQFIPHDM